MTVRARWLIALVALALVVVAVALVTRSRDPERLDDRLPPERVPDAERATFNRAEERR